MFELSAAQFILTSAKFILMISMDNGMFVFILLFVGFKVETDVEINKRSVPIQIFGNQFVVCNLKVQIWCSFIHFFFSKFSTGDSDGCHDIDFYVLSFLGFTLETDVEVDESALDWLFTTSCL